MKVVDIFIPTGLAKQKKLNYDDSLFMKRGNSRNIADSRPVSFNIEETQGL